MKTIFKSVLLLCALLMVAIGCKDEALDPLQFNKIEKGVILALRGDALTSLYVQGKPISEIFPRIYTGTEKFTFEAEILASDPSVVSSVDVFILKKLTATTNERIKVKTVDGAAFTLDKYAHPSAKIEIPVATALTSIGLGNTVPLSPGDINTLLTTYKFGVSIECDINLKDGSKILAEDIVNSGLFGSNQFYPAMRLTWAVTDYCTYNAAAWGANYDATETSDFFGGYGPYTITLVQDGVDPNKFSSDNWYDSGITAFFVLTPSTNVATQVVTVPKQTQIGSTRTIEGSGTYNQCLGKMLINFTYKNADGSVRDQFLWTLVKQ